MVALLLAAAMLLMSVALWNGYPLVFADSGTYLLTAIQMVDQGWLSVPWSRPPFYSLFMLPLHMKINLWPILLVQALITAHMLYITMRVTFGHVSATAYLATILLLTLSTSLPWFAGLITPDVFTAIVILGMYLLGFARDRLTTVETLYVLLLTTFAASSHYAHIPVAGGLALAILLHDLFVARFSGMAIHSEMPSNVAPHPAYKGNSRLKAPRHDSYHSKRNLGLGRIAMLFAPAVLATVALIGVNYASRGEVSAAPYSKIFLLARSIADGPAKQYLDDNCAIKRYALCEHLDALGNHSNQFLWQKDSPLYTIGIKQVRQEADEILKGSFRAYPLWSIRIATGHFLHQLVSFETGDWLTPYLSGSIENVISHHFPRSHADFTASAQNTSSLHLDSVRPLHLMVSVISLTLVLPALILLKRRDAKRMITLGLIILLGLIGNAAVCGPLSIVTDRYQSRVIWLVTFFIVMAVFALRNKHGSPSNQATGQT
jgi:hypothetical protein